MPRPPRFHVSSLLAALLLLSALPAAAQERTVLPADDRVLGGEPADAWTVGAAEGAEWQLLSAVRGVAFGPGDRLYVLDGGAHRVLVFDQAGRFVRQFGREGGGPGEFRVPFGIAVTARGEVAVTDLGARSVSYFSAGGEFLRSVAVEEGMLGRGLGAHPDGGVVAQVRTLPDGGDPDRPVALAHLPADGAGEARTLFHPREAVDVRRSTSRAGAERGVSVRIMQREFAPRLLWGVLPDGRLAVANTRGWTVKLVDDGRVAELLQRPLPVRLVSEADREWARARRREAMESGRGMIRIVAGGPGGAAASPPRISEEQIRAQLAQVEFADTMRAVDGMTVTPAGTIWLQRTADEPGGSGPIDLVRADGRYLGTLEGEALPDAVSRSGLAAYVETDGETGVERVVVRRLPEAWR